jgi:DNA-directed RNA polymerase subunit RPC12/RpoP
MSDSNSRYALARRVRLCLNCGSTMDAPMEGGTVTCEHCSTAVQVPPRSLEPLGSRSGAGLDDEMETPQQHQERLAILRKQAENYNPSNPYGTVVAPEGFRMLTALPDNDPKSLQKIMVLYREAYQRCEQQPTPQHEHEVYWFTWKLGNIFTHLSQSAHAWGVIHTSMDVLRNPGHQHILRAKAGNVARKAGDLDSAEAWLQLCDPAPTILDLDTAYRQNLAILHLARRRWERALALVGPDVPYQPAARVVVGAIGVMALEKLGRGAEAEAAMRNLLQQAEGAETALQTTLGPSSIFAPARPVWARVKQAAGPSLKKADEMVPASRWLLVIAGLLGLLAVLTIKDSVGRVMDIMDLRGWKPAKGRIEKVRTTELKSGSKSRAAVGVIFSFQVNGKTYRGRNVWPGEEWDDYSSTNQAATREAELRAHRDVTIYYNPQNPSQSAMKKSFAGHITKLVIMVLLTIGFLLTVFFLIRAYRRRNRAHAEFTAREM